MDKIERYIKVLKDRSAFEKISYVQNTNAIPLIFHIEDYHIPSGSTAKVYVQRPDGTIEYEEARINGNDITIDVKTTMFSVVGNSVLQIQITKGEKKLVTFGTVVQVKKNYYSAEGEESKNVVDFFEDAFNKMKESVDTAKESETKAKASETAAKSSETAAKASERAAKASQTGAQTSETNALASKNAAATSAVTATNKASEAAGSAENAASSKAAAETYAANAANSANSASASAVNSANSANNSEEYSKLSESWARGGTGERPGENTNSSKYFSDLANALVTEAQKLLDQAEKIVAAATQGALVPAGTITFQELPTEPVVGHMYNISNDFTTDNRFAEGAGVFYRAGANVYWSNDGKWDVMIGTQVTGVKGASETTYRVGNVNISKSDIGLGNVENKSSNTIRGEITKENVTSALGYTPPQTNTTYGDATTSSPGLMTAADKTKLNGIAPGANAYSLPLADSGTRGGAKTGYKQNGRNYPVQLSNEQMYVNVPWTDTNTQTITGVKGNAESAYRTGNVNITPANIGAIAESKIVKSTNITQEGFLMDGKSASDALAELNRKSYADGYVFVNCGSLPNNGTKNVNITLPDGTTDWWISEAWFRNPNLPNFRYTMPYIDVNTYSNSVGIGINNNKQISLITAANWTGYNAYAIVSYKL
ncbi:MAG: hypothetical protein K1W34_14225 [Lachnospiraceae bacterium]